MEKFIHVRSTKFRILPGEDDELVNEGTYGKSLAEYLRVKLTDRGYSAPFTCCEDWGWFVRLEEPTFSSGVCVYCLRKDDDSDRLDCCCMADTTRRRKWSWRRFRFVDLSPWIEKLHTDMLQIFTDDRDVEVLGVSDEFPLA